jgi:glucose-6-phosphate dehydrogenase assembly protein OpcA
MSAPAPPATLGMPVDLRDVEREIRRQLKDNQRPDLEPAQRVCMSNLVVYTDRPETAERIANEVPDITAVHPARVLLLLADPAGTGQEVTSSVLVRCRILTHKQLACSEQIALRAPAAQANRLAFAVRSLVIGDLPINLWWSSATPPPLAGFLLTELAESAQQIMYDSVGWPMPAVGVAATASWIEQTERTEAGRWRVCSDLNWRRLKYWRRLVSQGLDWTLLSEASQAELLNDVLIEHGPHGVVQAWELAGWLARRLGWKLVAGRTAGGVEMTWRFTASHGDVTLQVRRLPAGPPEILRLRMACRLGAWAGAINVTRESEQRLAITLEGMPTEPRSLMIPPISPAELVGRQLSDRARDPVFRESMQVAQQMARSVLP